MNVTGEFAVEMTPLTCANEGSDGMALARWALNKTFTGPLQAVSRGEMLSAITEMPGSAGYVALEQVSGTLNNRQGSFVLQHFGIRSAGSNRLTLEVVPDSAAGELAGLTGSMAIRIEAGVHFYDFDFELPDAF